MKKYSCDTFTPCYSKVQKNEELTQERLEFLLADLQARGASIWEDIYQLLGVLKLPGHYAILFEFPIKGPFLEIYDNLGSLFGVFIEKIKEREEEEKRAKKEEVKRHEDFKKEIKSGLPAHE